MSYFLTNPSAPVEPPKVPRRGRFVKYCERVVQELVHLGMPIRCAEVAIIDNRHTAFLAFNDKDIPLTAAERIFNSTKHIYTDTDEEGNVVWHYAN